MDRDGFFDSRLNMPRGHCGFAMCLIRKRNERPAPCVSHVISKVGLRPEAKAGFGEQYLTQIHDTMPEVRLEHYDQSE
jgi:hypothetical protein